MTEKLFNAANKLKSYSVSVGGVDVVKESIVSIEMKYSNDNPVIDAKLVVTDIMDLNSQQVWSDSTVIVKYSDVFDQKFSKEFIITNVAEKYNDRFEKTFVISLQDTFSYKLKNSFLSKSFSIDPVSALKEYTNKLEIDAIEGISYELSSIEGEFYFSVPKNTNNLDFFISLFKKHGYIFYQTKNKICVKSIEDTVPSSLPMNGEFKNETDNQLFKNKIMDMKISFNNRDETPDVTRTLAFDFNQKKVVFDDSNDNSSLLLNNDTTNIQDSEGYLDIYQQHLDFNEHSLKLKNSFTRQSDVRIVVNGYIKNDLMQQYKLILKGNVGSADSQVRGNKVVDGLYISSCVIDKIIGDSMIQNICLNRADLTLK